MDHPPGGHDDIANAVAGAVVLAAKCQVWDEREQESRMPITQHAMPDKLKLPLEKALHIQHNMTEEFEQWLRETEGEGVGKIIRR